MRKFLLMMTLTLGVLSVAVIYGFAQEAQQVGEAQAQPAIAAQPTETVAEAQPAQSSEEAPAEDQLFGFGKVVEITDKGMTLTEYDFETDQEMKVAYVLDEQTKLDNIKSLSEVKADDEVGVNYEEKEGKKIAKMVFKYVEMEEEGTGEDTKTSDAAEGEKAVTEPAAQPIQPVQPAPEAAPVAK